MIDFILNTLILIESIIKIFFIQFFSIIVQYPIMSQVFGYYKGFVSCVLKY